MKNYTDEQIKMICEGLANGDTAKTIADAIGVEHTLYFQSYMSRIRHKELWVDITKDYNFKETKRVKTIRKICTLIISGYTNYEICEKFNKRGDKNFYRTVRGIRKGDHHRNISIEYGIVDSLKEDTERVKRKKERIHKICGCIEKGMGSKEIAIELDEPYTNSLVTLVSKLRAKKIHKDICYDYRFKRMYRKHDIRRICEYMEQGYSNREIAKLMRIAYGNSFATYLSKVKHGKVRPEITRTYSFYTDNDKIRA